MASNRTEYELAIEIAGRVEQSFNRALGNATDGFSRIGKAAKVAAGIATAAFGAIKIAEFASDCVQAAMDVETAMSDVAKVVDGLRDETGGFTSEYYEMRDALTDMSKEIPMTVAELSEITAAAGQANIAKEDLLEFTETASKMGTAFDATAEDAGNWMAVWRTALDLTQEEVTVLGDQINYLGNTSSESALKISGIMTEVGSLAKVSGVTAQDLAAMAAATTGIDEAVAGTGLKNMFVALGKGASATKKQQKVLKKLGLSAKELAETMQTDARGAILSVLEGISALPAAEQEAAINDYFGKESLNTVAVLAGNIDNLKEQFEKVSDATRYAGSMEAEFAAKSDTTENKIQLAKNALQATKATLGNMFLPYVAKGANALSEFATKADDLVKKASPKINQFIQNAKAKATEIKDKVAQVLDANAPKIQHIIDVCTKLKEEFAAAFEKAKPIINDVATNAIPAIVNAVIIFLDAAASVYEYISAHWNVIGPICGTIATALIAIKAVKFTKWAITATKAMVALTKAKVRDKAETLYLKALYMKEAIARKAHAIAVGIQSAAMGVWSGVCTVATTVTTALGAAFTFLTSPIGLVIIAITAVIAIGVLLYKNWDTVKAKASQLATFLTGVFENIKVAVIEKINAFRDAFPTAFGIISGFFTGWADGIKVVIDGIKSIFQGVIDFFTGVFTGNWELAFQGLVNVVVGLFETIGGVIMTPFNGVIGAVNGIIDGINGALGKIKIPDWVPGWGGKTFNLQIPHLPMLQLAEGGIATGPTIAEIAEAGEPEAVIPLSKLADMLGLNNKQQTPALAGAGAGEPEAVIPLSKLADMPGLNNKQQIPALAGVGAGQIIYQPTYQFNGGTPTRDDLIAAERTSQAEFNQMMKRWLKDNSRKNF